jgi:hypothetical protein
MTTVWADADSLPEEARNLIVRRALAECARGATLKAVFAASIRLEIPNARRVDPEAVAASPVGIYSVRCPKGEGAVDEFIAGAAAKGDLAVTRDLPLAKRLVESGVACVNDRGEEWNADSIRERTSVRDFMLELREVGAAPASTRKRSYGERERNAFANAFDRALSKLLASSK